MPLDTLQRAKSYPYEIPPCSFVVVGDGHKEMALCAPWPDISGRRPVLAVGSNQSPEQLIRKFQKQDLGPIPVFRSRLKNFDIVYSPHIASYGAIPATLRHSPGTQVTLFVNWLTPEQEERMHETEVATGNYFFGKLDDIELHLGKGQVLTSAFVYCSRRGSLLRDGLPVALAAVEAENRRWPSLTQEDILSHVRDVLAPEHSIDSFIQSAISDISVRQARTEAMMKNSLPFNYAGFSPIDI